MFPCVRRAEKTGVFSRPASASVPHYPPTWLQIGYTAGADGPISTATRAWSKSGGRSRWPREYIEKQPKSLAGRRTINVSPWVLDALRDVRAKTLAEGNVAGPVFGTRRGTFIEKMNLIRRTFKAVLDKANQAAMERAEDEPPALLPPLRRFHDLQHTHATLLLSQGPSIKAVSCRLGHGKVDVTLRANADVPPTDDAKLAKGVNRLYG